MKTIIRILPGSAVQLDAVADATVDLVLTSPPYPMIAMWDPVFADQDPGISRALARGDGDQAFERMHALLDCAWDEVFRVLRPGGIVCINIGDATRTINQDFRLYSNHARILHHLLQSGFVALPDILWRKPTNAPSKFMGSGMLPVGAYVTYEHEYILVVRKGNRREFRAAAEKQRRRESAFFWEERNVWFSDIWLDLKGAPQQLVDRTVQRRSAAFPFELAHRLICMFSIKQDTVLDPFLGTGTALAAAATTGRNAIGIELDQDLLQVAQDLIPSVPAFANRFNAARLGRHLEFVTARTCEAGPMKHTNQPYGFPVMTTQERELLINPVLDLREIAAGTFEFTYSEVPQELLSEA